MSSAALFLAAIQPQPLGNENVEGRYISLERKVARYFYQSHAELLANAARFTSANHVYVSVALRRGHDGTARGVSRAGATWADIDGKLWPGVPDPKRAALLAVEAFLIRPTAVVSTGGGYQPYWALTEPLDLRQEHNRARLELVNAGLARAVCGPERRPDSAHDVARVLRLPGTLNLKPEYGEPRPVTVVWCEPERRYLLDDLEAGLAEHWSWALKGVGSADAAMPDIALSTTPPHKLWLMAARGRIRPSTLALLDGAGPARYSSPSEADAAIAAGLLGVGLTTGETLALISASPRGQDARHRKGAHDVSYWRRTITNAAAFLAGRKAVRT